MVPIHRVTFVYSICRFHMPPANAWRRRELALSQRFGSPSRSSGECGVCRYPGRRRPPVVATWLQTDEHGRARSCGPERLFRGVTNLLVSWPPTRISLTRQVFVWVHCLAAVPGPTLRFRHLLCVRRRWQNILITWL